MPDADVPDVPDRSAPTAKQALRSRMRGVRQRLVEAGVPGERSGAVAERFAAALAPRRPRRVLSYEAIPGEVDTAAIHDWLGSIGAEVVVVDPTPTAAVPVGADWPDLIVVPGLAFDRRGGRLGQGGGWYDRLLHARAGECLAVGVGVEEMWVDHVPLEPHDVCLDAVVTERGATWCDPSVVARRR